MKINLAPLFFASLTLNACAPMDRQPAAAVNEQDTYNFDVSVKGQLASDCGLLATEDRVAFEASKGDALDKVAACVTVGDLKDRKIRIMAYTDARGPARYNKELGKARADVVASYLVSKGVSEAKIFKITHGENLAVGDNQSEYKDDRHVDVEIVN